MTASQALIHYKGRDVSEKLFSADKSFIGSKSMRVQTTQALSAKIFVEFIALIVRNRMYNLLKETMLRLETKPNYMTVPAALRELEKIEMVRRAIMVITAWIMPLRKNKKRYLAHSACLIQMSKA